MLRGRPTSVQHFHNPACRHPWAKQISHAAYEDGLRLLDVLRLLKPVAVERRLEAKGIGGIDRLAVGPSDSEWLIMRVDVNDDCLCPRERIIERSALLLCFRELFKLLVGKVPFQNV